MKPIIEDPAIKAYVESLESQQRGLTADLQAERKLRQDAQAAAAAAQAEAESAKTAAATQVAELQSKAKSWEDHTAAQAKARDDANAAKLAALPEATRATYVGLGLDSEKLAALLSTVPAPADPAQQGTQGAPVQPPAPPVIPGTGRVPSGAQGDGVPAEVQAWIDGSDVGRKYRNAGPAMKQLAYNKEGPGASAPK